MDQTFLVRGPQTSRDLNASLEDTQFGHTPSLRHQVIQTAVVDQFHHEIKLTVICAGRKNLDDVRIIDRSGRARFLFEPARFVGIGAQFFPQNLQRYETIQPRVARFIN